MEQKNIFIGVGVALSAYAGFRYLSKSDKNASADLKPKVAIKPSILVKGRAKKVQTALNQGVLQNFGNTPDLEVNINPSVLPSVVNDFASETVRATRNGVPTQTVNTRNLAI